MTLYHKWDVKNGFVYVLQFFSLISDGLGGVIDVQFLCKYVGQACFVKKACVVNISFFYLGIEVRRVSLTPFCKRTSATVVTRNRTETSWMQSHYREVPRWEIFLEQELRFGLDLSRLGVLKKKDLGRLFKNIVSVYTKKFHKMKLKKKNLIY